MRSEQQNQTGFYFKNKTIFKRFLNTGIYILLIQLFSRQKINKFLEFSTQSNLTQLNLISAAHTVAYTSRLKSLDHQRRLLSDR